MSTCTHHDDNETDIRYFRSAYVVQVTSAADEGSTNAARTEDVLEIGGRLNDI
jgi:hypothetical protein